MSENFLTIHDLVVEYSSGGQIVQAVNGVDLKLAKGQTLGLVGETGAGKTTIAKAILRILPTPPARVKQGEIYLDGEDLLKLPEKDMLKVRGNKIAMIFQDPMTALNPTMTVGDQISEVVLQHNDFTKAQAQERTIEMLEMVGIASVRYMDYPHQFSGGMKQRVALVIALACNPDLLIADEPTSALDVTIQAQVLEMIEDLQRHRNTAMIMITHDFGVVAKSCNKVAVVYAGEIIEYGTIEQVFERPMHPYTVGLFGAIPNLTTDVDRLTPIPGAPPDPTDLPGGCKFLPRCPHATEQCKRPVPAYTMADGHQCRCNLYADEAKPVAAAQAAET